MDPTPDVLVVGGGIIGLTAAYHLATAGIRVEVLERGEPGKEASWAGAGIIPPGNPDRATMPIDKLRAIGAKRFPDFAAELKGRTGIDPGYLACGGIEFLADGDEHVVHAWAAEGIEHTRLNAHTIREVESGFGRADGTPYYLPGTAQVRNPRLMKALRTACAVVGVPVHAHAAVRRWWKQDGTVAGVELHSGEVRQAPRFVLAAGAWAEPFLAPLGVRPGVHPIRGQIVVFRTSPDRPHTIVVVGKQYIVPRGDGLVLVGSTEEPEAGFEKGITEAGQDRLRSFAREVIPALGSAPVEAFWSGLRPGSPDGLPFLGPVPGHENVFAAVGHFRAGVQLSIGTAEVVTAWAAGKNYPVPIEQFRLDRAGVA